MMYQRIHKSSSRNPRSQEKSSQLAPRPFTVQAQRDSLFPPTEEEIENEAFNQNKYEANGLQQKKESGTITPVEQERLSVLQAKRDDFWAQRLERTSRFRRNFANIPVHSPDQQVSAPVQSQPVIQPYRAGFPLQYPQQPIASDRNGGMSMIQRKFMAMNQQRQHERQLMPPIQAKLTIGRPNDKYEQEADRVAAQVVKQINAPASAQSTPGQSVQPQEEPDEELQAKPEITVLQRQEAIAGGEAPSELTSELAKPRVSKTEGDLTQETSSAPIQAKEAETANKKGLPDPLKTGIEHLSGYSMDDVKVHYNSVKPALLQAHAYAQGTDIHIAQGQEEHLPHEAWHVVQQKQGRVKPTVQMKGEVYVNDDKSLEQEADVMGEKSQRKGIDTPQYLRHTNTLQEKAIQRKIGAEIETGLKLAIPNDKRKDPETPPSFRDLSQGQTCAKMQFKSGLKAEIHAESPRDKEATLEFATEAYSQNGYKEISLLHNLVFALADLTKTINKTDKKVYNSEEFPVEVELPFHYIQIRSGSTDGAFQVNVSPTGFTAEKLDQVVESHPRLSPSNNYQAKEPNLSDTTKVQKAASQTIHKIAGEVKKKITEILIRPSVFASMDILTLTKAIVEPAYVRRFFKDFEDSSLKNTFALFPRVDLQSMIGMLWTHTDSKQDEFRDKLCKLFEDDLKYENIILPEGIKSSPFVKKTNIITDSKKYAQEIIKKRRPLVADRSKMAEVSKDKIEKQNPVIGAPTSSNIIPYSVAPEGVWEVRNPFTSPINVDKWSEAIKAYENYLISNGISY